MHPLETYPGRFWMNTPLHVAIIMDGNGRWAKKRGLPRLSGHKQGAEVLKKITQFASEEGIKYLTVYAFSSENWGRPESEVRGLMTLLNHYLDKEEASFFEKDIRLRVIGDKTRLPPSVQERIKRIEDASANQQGLSFQIALSYGSRPEIVNATQSILTDVANGTLKPENLTESLFSTYLYTKDLPDPDLLIRTGGEKRLSNFLLWQSAYTELDFIEKYWPDFTPADLSKILKAYHQRSRRFGKHS